MLYSIICQINFDYFLAKTLFSRNFYTHFSFKEDRWVHLSDMPVRRCRCGVAVVRGLVYAVGGFNGSLRVRTVDVYDPARDSWSSAPNMEARRSTLGVAVLNDQIYAVGGFDGSTGLNSAEVLDLSVSTPTLQSVAGYLDPGLNENRMKRYVLSLEITDFLCR